MQSVVYRIAGWDEHFENNESRKLVYLKRVQFPNKMDGIGFKRVVRERERCDLYCAWHLICAVVSQNKRGERGYTKRDDHALTPDDFSLITGFPPDIFEKAIRFFSDAKIGWLIPVDHTSPTAARLPQSDTGKHPERTAEGASSTDSTAPSQPDVPTPPERPGERPGMSGDSAGNPPSSPSSPPMEGRKDGIGREGQEGEARAREGEGCAAPTWDEVKAFASGPAAIGEQCASVFFNDMEACGWLDGRQRPIVRWKHALVSFSVRWRANDHKAKAAGQSGASSPGEEAKSSLWALKTQLDGVEAEIKKIERQGYEDPTEGLVVPKQLRPRRRELRTRRDDLQRQIADFGK